VVSCYDCRKVGHYKNECPKPAKERGRSISIETQEEERPTLLGKKMKLPPILVTPKTRMKTTYPSLVKCRKLKMM